MTSVGEANPKILDLMTLPEDDSGWPEFPSTL